MSGQNDELKKLLSSPVKGSDDSSMAPPLTVSKRL